jgi:hypothetical protein
VERFLLDLGLVAVEPAASQQQVGNGHNPADKQVEGVAAKPEPELGAQVSPGPARRSVPKRLIELVKRVTG